jgi:hypothetical protein
VRELREDFYNRGMLDLRIKIADVARLNSLQGQNGLTFFKLAIAERTA